MGISQPSKKLPLISPVLTLGGTEISSHEDMSIHGSRELQSNRAFQNRDSDVSRALARYRKSVSRSYPREGGRSFMACTRQAMVAL
jgi:hypothetical protein